MVLHCINALQILKGSMIYKLPIIIFLSSGKISHEITTANDTLCLLKKLCPFWIIFELGYFTLQHMVLLIYIPSNHILTKLPNRPLAIPNTEREQWGSNRPIRKKL